MEVTSFKKKIDDFRISQKSFKNWWYVDKSSSQEKIIGRVSVLSRWDMHSHSSDNDYSLLDSTFSVNIFHDNNRFTNFKKAIKGQELLCNTDTIAIEGWRKILLLLRIED